MNGLLHHRPALARLPRAGIVHRLDRETSGLLVVAKTERAFASLSAQLAERSMGRRYLALAVGIVLGLYLYVRRERYSEPGPDADETRFPRDP